jgi:hypothetical protein
MPQRHAETQAGGGPGLASAALRDDPPRSYRPVEAASGEGPPVGTERDTVNRAGVRLERRSELFAAGTERDTIDGTDEPLERPDQIVAPQVPQLDRPVLGGSCESLRGRP